MRQTLRLAKQAGFLKRSLQELQFETQRIVKGSYIYGKYDDLNLLSFDDVSDSDGIKVMCDADIGGYSTAAFDIIDTRTATSIPTTPASSASESGSSMTTDPTTLNVLDPPIYARFHGTISLDLPKHRPDIQRSGYAGFRQHDPRASIFGTRYVDIDPFRFLAFRIKTDARKYFVNLQTDSIINTDLHQHRLLAKTPGKWETLVIPVKDFVRTRSGWVVYPIQGMLTSKIKTVGISVTDRVAGPFEVCVERIWATNDPPATATRVLPMIGKDGDLELD